MNEHSCIVYKDTHDLGKEELTELFLSVEWNSGKYPEKLCEAMRNYKTVFTAWDGNRLVGLISVMDDSVMTAYVHYLLVDREYQKLGIGKELIEMVKRHYMDYMKICLIAEDDAVGFYERCGFWVCQTAKPMYISKL